MNDETLRALDPTRGHTTDWWNGYEAGRVAALSAPATWAEKQGWPEGSFRDEWNAPSPTADAAALREACPFDCDACNDPGPCSCGGRRWVEDENWSSDYPGAGERRTPGDGLIPCGSCNFAGWDTPENAPTVFEPPPLREALRASAPGDAPAPTVDAAALVIADIDARLAKLSLGGGYTKPRREAAERWAAAHLRGVRAVAEAALRPVPAPTVDAAALAAIVGPPSTGTHYCWATHKLDAVRAALRASAPGGPTVEIRATHWAGFRSGQWAVVTGVEWANDRPCFAVRFPDGKTDSWVMVDPSDPYEFRASAPGDETP
jgi:hypothetical protein